MTPKSTLNEVYTKKLESTKKGILEIASAIEPLIPSLNVIGMFDLFEPDHWIGSGEQPGRILAVSLYFKHYPEKWSQQFKSRVCQVKDTIFSPYLREQLEDLEC